jgi:hypothetical protein
MVREIVRQGSWINEGLRTIFRIGRINEVKFVYSPLNEIPLKRRQIAK